MERSTSETKRSPHLVLDCRDATDFGQLAVENTQLSSYLKDAPSVVALFEGP